jgi:hypothetical protein
MEETMFNRKRRWRNGARHKRALGAAFRFLLENHTWKRHPEPFSKSKRGRQRRQERRFVLATNE